MPGTKPSPSGFSHKSRRIWIPGLSFLLTVGVALYFWSVLQSREEQHLRDETEIRALQIVDNVEKGVQKEVSLLDYLAALPESRYLTSRELYTAEITKLLQFHPVYQALNLIDADWTIQWVVPYEGNAEAEGKNLRTLPLPSVMESIELALATDTTTRSSVRDLLQGGKGFATYRAVRDGSGEVLGFLNGVFKIETLLDHYTADETLRRNFAFAIQAANEELVYLHGDEDTLMTSPYLIQKPVQVLQRGMTLLVAPSKAHLHEIFGNPSDWLLVFVCLLSLAVAILFFSILHQTETLRQNEERYRMVVDTQSDLICRYKPDGTLLFVSPSYCRTFGKQESEIVGGSFRQYIHEEDVERVDRELQEIFKPPHVLTIKERALTVDGIRWQEWRAHGILDEEGNLIEVAAVGRDITEQQEAERALGQSEARFRNLFEGASDACYVCDADGFIREVNEAACLSTGYSREELTRMHVTDVDKVFPRDVIQSLYASIEFGKPGRAESIHFRKDGTCFPVEVHVSLLQEGTEKYYIGLARDMTERVRMEEEKHELSHRLQQVEKVESLGVLAGGVAHDFNNLLLAIIGNADLALSELGPHSPYKDYLEEILQAGNRAAVLCNQMLAYSGKGRFYTVAKRIDQAIGEENQTLQDLLAPPSRLEYHFAPNTPEVEMDPRQFRQLLLNLVTNAVEALPPTGGYVAIRTGVAECDREFLKGLVFGDEAEPGVYGFITVEDNGCGMDSLVQRRLFDPFFSTKFTGRGLGMSAVHGIVRGHRGLISVKSEAESGTKITVYLPVHKQQEPVIEEEITRATGDNNGVKILLVDDEASVRSLGGRMLKKLGYGVIEASSGREAVHYYSQNRNSIALVLLDLTMPDMDGDQTALALQEINPEVPILMTSGYSELTVAEIVEMRGLKGFLTKPYQIEMLRKEITAVIGPPTAGGTRGNGAV